MRQLRSGEAEKRWHSGKRHSCRFTRGLVFSTLNREGRAPSRPQCLTRLTCQLIGKAGIGKQQEQHREQLESERLATARELSIRC